MSTLGDSIMSDKDYFRLALGEIEDDLKNDFKSGLGFGLIAELIYTAKTFLMPRSL